MVGVDRTDSESPMVMEERTFMAMINRMRDRMSLLQAEVDRHGEEWLKSLTISSASEAVEARDTFTKAWFSKSLYTIDLQKRIAQTLIDSTVHYPFIDIQIWQQIVRS